MFIRNILHRKFSHSVSCDSIGHKRISKSAALMCQTMDQQSVENGDSKCDTQPQMCNSVTQKRKGIYIEDALTKSNFGFFNYFLIWISGTIFAAVFFENCAIGFILPVSQCDLDLSTQQKGILGGVSFVGIICSSHLWGFLADTKGRKFIIQPTLMIAFCLSVSSSFSNNFYTMASLRFLNGFFISGSSATIYAYLGEYHNTLNRSRAIMGGAIICGIYCLFLPIMAWIVINHDWYWNVPLIGITYRPWRLFLIVCSLPGFSAAMCLFFIHESPRFTLGQGKQNEAIKALNQVDRWNNGSKASLELVELIEETDSIENRQQILKNKSSRFPLMKSIWSQTVPLFMPPYLKRTLLVCAIQFGVCATANGFYLFFTEILNRMAKNLDTYDTRISMCNAINMNIANVSGHSGDHDIFCVTQLETETLEQSVVLEIFFTIGFVLVGFSVNKFGKLPVLLIVFSGCGAAGITCMLTNNPMLQIGCFMVLMMAGLATNVVNAATVGLYPTSVRAMAMCMALMFGRLGGFSGSNIAAYFLNGNCEMAFYFSGTSLIVCALLSFLIPNIRQKVPKTESKLQPRASVISTTHNDSTNW